MLLRRHSNLEVRPTTKAEAEVVEKQPLPLVEEKVVVEDKPKRKTKKEE